MAKDLLKIFLFFFFKIIPKKKNLIVFGDRAGLRFADNSRHLFFYLNKNYKKFQCVWITKNKKILKYLNDSGYLSYHCYSIRGLYYCLIAKWHLYNFAENDINPVITRFSNSILLWHGVLPKKLKKIYISTSFISRIINQSIKKFFLYTNKNLSTNIFQRFQKDKYKLIISDLPRNFILQNPKHIKYFITKDEINFIKNIQNSNKKVFGYFPTWRKNGLELFLDVKDFKLLKKTDEILRKNNSIILVKKHMNSEKNDKNAYYNEDIEKISNYLSSLKSVRFINYQFDLNSILSICDVLISDYSGVIFDFLYLNKPIIIYAPDYKKFKKENGFIIDPINENIGHYARNLENLNQLINEYSLQPQKFSNQFEIKRIKLKDKIFTKQNSINEIIDILNN